MVCFRTQDGYASANNLAGDTGTTANPNHTATDGSSPWDYNPTAGTGVSHSTVSSEFHLRQLHAKFRSSSCFWNESVNDNLREGCMRMGGIKRFDETGVVEKRGILVEQSNRIVFNSVNSSCLLRLSDARA